MMWSARVVITLAICPLLFGVLTAASAQSELERQLFGKPPPARSPAPNRDALLKQRYQLVSERQVLENELRNEQNRVASYLTLADHILTIQFVLSNGAPDNRQQTLGGARQRLYQSSFGEQDWNQLLQQHQAWVGQYFGRIEHWIQTSRGWPSGRAPAEWQGIAARELGQVRQQYTQRLSQGGDPTQELRRANQILRWAQGSTDLAGAHDHFGPVPQRVAFLMAQVPN